MDVQFWIAIAIVALAAMILVRRVWNWIRQGGVGGCGSCQRSKGATAVTVKPLTQISIKPKT